MPNRTDYSLFVNVCPHAGACDCHWSTKKGPRELRDP
jgi:hypothetical protein